MLDAGLDVGRTADDAEFGGGQRGRYRDDRQAAHTGRRLGNPLAVGHRAEAQQCVVVANPGRRRKATDLGGIDRAASAENDDKVGACPLDRFDECEDRLERRMRLQVMEDGKGCRAECVERRLDDGGCQKRGGDDGQHAGCATAFGETRDDVFGMRAIVHQRLAEHGERSRRYRGCVALEVFRRRCHWCDLHMIYPRREGIGASVRGFNYQSRNITGSELS